MPRKVEEDAVKRKQFIVEQIVHYKQVEMGTPVSVIIRYQRIAEQTFYRRK